MHLVTRMCACARKDLFRVVRDNELNYTCHHTSSKLFSRCGLVAEVLHGCGGIHYGEAEGLVSVERWSCSRGASYVVEYTMGRLRDWSL